MPSDTEPSGRPKSVIALLNERRASGLRPRLSMSDRQRCVDHLQAEGATLPQMAELLGVCEKTISRDRKALQDRHALEIDVGFGKRLAGELLRQAEISISNLRRLGRDQHAGLAERVLANVKAFEVIDRLTSRLQSMGYAETAATSGAQAPHEDLRIQAIHVASIAQAECADDAPLINSISRMVASLGPVVAESER